MKWTAIITGDIVNSRKADPKRWVPVLKEILTKYGSEPECWEIYRGDSFQLEVPPEDALEVALHIKAGIKIFKELDVRQAIGIGEKKGQGSRITESHGPAFEYSGNGFEELKKRRLLIRAPWDDFNTTMNLIIELLSLSTDNWTPTSAEIIRTAIENQQINQQGLAKILGIKQSNVSRGLKRGAYDEMIRTIGYYRMKINELCRNSL